MSAGVTGRECVCWDDWEGVCLLGWLGGSVSAGVTGRECVC